MRTHLIHHLCYSSYHIQTCLHEVVVMKYSKKGKIFRMRLAFLIENQIKFLMVISDVIKPREIYVTNDSCDAFGFIMKE